MLSIEADADPAAKRGNSLLLPPNKLGAGRGVDHRLEVTWSSLLLKLGALSPVPYVGHSPRWPAPRPQPARPLRLLFQFVW